LTDGTLIVADAPAANQPLNDVHVFTDDAQHFAFGQSGAFHDVICSVFVQKDDGSFYRIVSREVGTANPNPVPMAYTDATRLGRMRRRRNGNPTRRAADNPATF
jgi:hypothetical protein